MRLQYVLLWHTKKPFSNKSSSTSLSEADLGAEEEPEYVESWEDQGCIPRDSSIWHICSAEGWAQKRRSYNLPTILCNPDEMYDEIFNKVLNHVTNIQICSTPDGSLRKSYSGQGSMYCYVRGICWWGNDSSSTPEEWKQLADSFFKRLNFPKLRGYHWWQTHSQQKACQLLF